MFDFDFPLSITMPFILTTFITIVLFLKATHWTRKPILILFGWLTLQWVLSYAEFYERLNTVPPRFVFLIIPALIFMIVVFATTAGRNFVDGLSLKWLTWVSVVRIPVELVLYALFIQKAVPEIMTFAGYNFDILAGISAPIMVYLVFVKDLSKKWLLVWNLLALGLLLTIISIAVLSAPLPFQQLSFDQPNLAVLMFPFNALPSVIVTVVLFTHFASIYRLTKRETTAVK